MDYRLDSSFLALEPSPSWCFWDPEVTLFGWAVEHTNHLSWLMVAMAVTYQLQLPIILQRKCTCCTEEDLKLVIETIHSLENQSSEKQCDFIVILHLIWLVFGGRYKCRLMALGFIFQKTKALSIFHTVQCFGPEMPDPPAPPIAKTSYSCNFRLRTCV